MKKINILKKIGEKAATMSVDPMCYPKAVFEPTPPKKIQQQMLKNK